MVKRDKYIFGYRPMDSSVPGYKWDESPSLLRGHKLRVLLPAQNLVIGSFQQISSEQSTCCVPFWRPRNMLP